MTRPFPFWRILAAITALVLIAASVVWWGDIVRTTLDPKIPFQTYTPPKAPDYTKADSWAARPVKAKYPLDVFYIAPTAFEGGKDWNAPLDDLKMGARFQRTLLPNDTGSFAPYANIYAPLYRQAALYAFLNVREDAREARKFAYQDVRAAFRHYLKHDNGGRPFILIGVEQGGLHLQRLLQDEIALPAVRPRLVAAYVIGSAVPSDAFQGALKAFTPCVSPLSIGCVASWNAYPVNAAEDARTFLDRAYVWNESGDLIAAAGRPILCVNPLLWTAREDYAPARLHRGGVNATGLEPDSLPPPLQHQTSAQCQGGILVIDQPRAASLNPSGTWAEQHMASGYNLFYADIAADGARRFANWRDDPTIAKSASSLEDAIEVRDVPVHKVD